MKLKALNCAPSSAIQQCVGSSATDDGLKLGRSDQALLATSEIPALLCLDQSNTRREIEPSTNPITVPMDEILLQPIKPQLPGSQPSSPKEDNAALNPENRPLVVVLHWWFGGSGGVSREPSAKARGSSPQPPTPTTN